MFRVKSFVFPSPERAPWHLLKYILLYFWGFWAMSQFSQKIGTANTGLLLISNMFALSGETRVKNGYHIYILNRKLGNSREKKRILPQRAQYLWGGGIQVINCICQLSLGYAVVTSNSTSFCFLKQWIYFSFTLHIRQLCYSHSGT